MVDGSDVRCHEVQTHKRNEWTKGLGPRLPKKTKPPQHVMGGFDLSSFCREISRRHPKFKREKLRKAAEYRPEPIHSRRKRVSTYSIPPRTARPRRRART